MTLEEKANKIAEIKKEIDRVIGATNLLAKEGSNGNPTVSDGIVMLMHYAQISMLQNQILILQTQAEI